jgi:hypothetical protein
MWRSIARKVILFSIPALLAACGDQSLFMSLKNDTADLTLTTVSDGQILTSGKPLPLMIAAEDTGKSRDVEVEVTLTSPAGQSVWHNRASAAVNEQSPISLPADLPIGMYRLDLVLYSSGVVAQKKSASFFVAGDGWKITGIKSFPPVITAAASVMLKAELQVPPGSDAWLRWSWKNKVIAKGALSKGLGQVLWTAPSDVGVYTITLEVFPSQPPAGTDFPFTSSLALSTDIFVSSGKTFAGGDLGPEASFLSLLHMQANLSDAGAGARTLGKPSAVAVGSPEVVSLEDGFGYRLNGSNGIRIPWLALPLEGGELKPFTVSIDVTLDNAAGRLLTATPADHDALLTISVDPEQHLPRAQLSAGGAGSLSIPWTGPALAPNQRYLLSLSIVAQGGTIAAQWFLDGMQVSRGSWPFTLPALRQEGSMLIGGEKGFKGVVDEFGVYYRDPAGRPSTDPDLYLRAQAVKYGASLAMANGFDGMFLPDGFSLKGGGQQAGGSLALSPGALLGLPAVKTEGSPLTFSALLGGGSSAAAVLQAQWEGSSEAPLQVPLAADSSRMLHFRVAADGASLLLPAGGAEKAVTLPAAPSAGAGLILRIGAPAEASTPLVLDSLLAVKDRK